MKKIKIAIQFFTDAGEGFAKEIFEADIVGGGVHNAREEIHTAAISAATIDAIRDGVFKLAEHLVERGGEEFDEKN